MPSGLTMPSNSAFNRPSVMINVYNDNSPATMPIQAVPISSSVVTNWDDVEYNTGTRPAKNLPAVQVEWLFFRIVINKCHFYLCLHHRWKTSYMASKNRFLHSAASRFSGQAIWIFSQSSAQKASTLRSHVIYYSTNVTSIAIFHGLKMDSRCLRKPSFHAESPIMI